MKNSNKIIHCTVTNDLNQDQRMHRICNTLTDFGYEILLIGRAKLDSEQLLNLPFSQKRISCFFQKGAFFYAEYNVRLWWYLLTHHQDIIYSVDTDTILPCTLVNLIKSKKMIFDAHEYFTEVPELKDKPMIKKIWDFIENNCIPHANLAITVNESLATLFSQKFKIPFYSIYNVPLYEPKEQSTVQANQYILYQGVLNKGRGLEEMIDAMQHISVVTLVIAGEGDLSRELRRRTESLHLSNKIIFKGWQSPAALKKLTSGALLGLNLLDGNSENYYYSLANKFFDYMHAGVPSINMKFPEYERIINEFDVGYMLSNLSPSHLADQINQLVNDTGALDYKRKECAKAMQKYQWQNETVKLKRLMDLL